MNIEGKVAVITGGASGLGRATAEMIIAIGGKVAGDFRISPGPVAAQHDDSCLAEGIGSRFSFDRGALVNLASDAPIGGHPYEHRFACGPGLGEPLL